MTTRTTRTWLAISTCLLAIALGACRDSKDTLYVVRRDRPRVSLVIPEWRTRLQAPLEDKLAELPAGVLPYLAQENKADGFSAVPRGASINDRLKSTYREALAGMPDSVRRLVSDRLLAVYFVADLGSSGFTQVLSDRDGRVVGGFIVLDAEAIDHDPNEWVSWKERSPFTKSDNISVQAVIEYPPNDTKASTLQYLLLHEFGHVIAATHDLLPRWNTKPASEVAAYQFATYSWQDVNGKLLYTKEYDFPYRSRIHYYAPPEKLQPASLLPRIYEDWSKTPFPTLYASQGVDDDFADSFASYVHTQLLHRPWKVVLRESGQVRTINDCWSEPRCAEKRRFFEKLLQSTGSP